MCEVESFRGGFFFASICVFVFKVKTDSLESLKVERGVWKYMCVCA